jgi:hypothetical protein
MRADATYKARDDDGGRLREYPAFQCVVCGAVEPDPERVDTMPAGDVPSSIKLRCARIRAR